MASQGNGLYTLATIIKRLEAVASRIEDVADIQEQRVGINNPNPGSSQTAPIPSPLPPPPPPPPVVIEDPKAATVYDKTIIEGKLKPFIKLTNTFGGDGLKEQVSLLEPLFGAIRQVIHTAGNCVQPPQDDFTKLLGPVQSGYQAVSLVKERNNRDREWSLHYSVIATGASCVSWVKEAKPGEFVKNTREETEFYGNRLIRECGEKDVKHVEWVRAFMELLEELRKYNTEYHKTGLSWNPKGIPLSEYKATPATGGVPPPPPPPPPAPGPPPAPAPDSEGGVAAVFAELNRGADVTKGLRKVEKSEMTHKNPALRASSTVPSNTSPSLGKKPTKPAKPQSLSTKKPAKFALEGNKWIIEYQENEPGLTVEDAEISHVISLYGCKNTTVVIKGKVNGVTIVNCTKTSVLVESVISSVSVTASPSFAIQITGSAPTIQLDSTDSGQIYLSKSCLGVEILTAKCSAINVSLPVEGEEEGIFEEKPIPEMLRTIVQNGALVTGVVEHKG